MATRRQISVVAGSLCLLVLVLYALSSGSSPERPEPRTGGATRVDTFGTATAQGELAPRGEGPGPAEEHVPDHVPAPSNDDVREERESPRDLLHEIQVEVLDDRGGPIEGADVWLAGSWRSRTSLRSDAQATSAITDRTGMARMRRGAGRSLVHVHHTKYVCDPARNGDALVLAVPEELRTTVIMSEVHVFAFIMEPGITLLKHSFRRDHGKHLRMPFNVVGQEGLQAVRQRILDDFPGCHVDAMVATGQAGEGRYSLLLWPVGMTPFERPYSFVPLGDFIAPVRIGIEGSSPASDFGSAVVRLRNSVGAALEDVPLTARRRSGPDDTPLLRDLVLEFTSGDPVVLPSGEYDIGVPGHVFLDHLVKGEDPLVVYAGSIEERIIDLKRPLVRMQLLLEPPEGWTIRPYVLHLRDAITGVTASHLEQLVERRPIWWLPEGSYEFIVRVPGPSPESHLAGAGTWQAVARETDTVIQVPVGLSVRTRAGWDKGAWR